MKKCLLVLLALLLCSPAFASVGVKVAGVYQGPASDIDFSSGTSVTYNGNTAVITGTNTGSTAAITSGTINGATIGATTPSTGAFTTLTAKQIGRTKVALTPGSSVAIDATAGSVFTLTPGQAESITVTGQTTGQIIYLIVTTSGTSSYTLTFSTGFKTTGTLATGTADAKTFVMEFVSDGTTCYEQGRTTAM